MTRILIADDNLQNLYLLESILKGYRFEVVSARNGAEALVAAKKFPPDLIIADILMPVMDGFDLCRKWKADEQLNPVPFMFYTATYTDPKDEKFAMSLGAERFVVKPQKPEVLGEMVRELLEEARKKPHGAPAKPPGDEREVLREYNDVLFRKLERKVIQLETEIADRKRAGEELLQSEARYRKLYESMMDAFVRFDMAGHVLEFNQSFRDLLGYSDRELVLMTNEDLTPEKWHVFENYIQETQILRFGDSHVYEKELQKKDGTVFPVELRTFLIRDNYGHAEGMWAIVRDITERRKSEKSINLANSKLALMTGVTYQDIQNKVTALRGYVEFGRKAASEKDRNFAIEKEMEILETIHNLIKKTKDYQQMGIDQSRWIPLEPTIRMQFSLQSLAHSVALDLDMPGLEIYSDPMIERVFYNIIHNAIQHGKKLTRISFGCEVTPDGLLVFCEDDGIGIPLEQKPHIFDRVVGGIGTFGLFFVREFLTLYGMTIRETGIPGSGARFEIFVPKGMYRFSAGTATDPMIQGNH